MEYIYLGNSGLRVPKYILRTILFSGTNGFEPAGDVKEGEARRMSVARPAPFYPHWHRAMSATQMGSPSEIEYLKGYKESMGMDD